jgi:phospho-N-acetylmuramoyl-pentapeptide-transferase
MVIAFIIAGFCSLIITALLGFFLIPYLKRLKFGQTILDIGPIWHKDKQGTPTMGGIMFIVGIVIATLIGYQYARSLNLFMLSDVQNARLYGGVLMALAFGFIGFVDDYIKVVKKQNLGLSARQKLVMQFIVACFYLFTLYIAGDTSTIVTFPFLGQFDFSLFYYPIMVFLIVGVVNAVNLTDGVDGLASSVTFAFSVVFVVIASILNANNMGIFAVALACGCLGFLIWNFYPAKVFMGDTGSMFLGGSVVALSFGVGLPVLVLIVGFVYIFEALSVIIQVISFKSTGKRVFKMSPIHHHFEMCGWSEVKIVCVFSLVTIVLGAVSIYAITLI